MRGKLFEPLFKSLIAVIAFFILAWLISTYGYQLFNLSYETASDIRLFRAVIVQVALDGFAILLVFLLYRMDSKPLYWMGFKFTRKAAGITGILLLILLVEYLALIMITGYTNTAEWKFTPDISIRYLFQAVLVFIMIGIGEEMLFRGYVFRKLLAYGKKAAYLLAALVFAVPHFIGSPFDIMRLLSLIVLALFFTYIYDKTGSIIPGIIIHSSMDLISFLVIKNKAGVSLFSYNGSIQALNYLSILAILLQFLVIYFAYRARKAPEHNLNGLENSERVY